ncbi:SUN-domain-containing protein [Ascodesmis nigricans]|uniref:SUN-domain-containing protein n=1 Tax=Ascodesmis nigricans TaxID=341454 RepID=A0A4S2MYF0_9PEZI|nr:SUN-domain-containing protein [Ascodesmis nigricans]
MHIDSALVIALTAFASLSAAQPHRKHRHVRHIEKRALVTATVTHWVDGQGNPVVPAATATPVSKPVIIADNEMAPQFEQQAAQKKPKVETTKAAEPEPEPAPKPESEPEPETKPADTSNLKDESRNKASGSSSSLSGTGLDRDFPDGQLSCNQFPSEYGAIATGWITKQGWSGIQLMEVQAAGDIRLANGDGVGECKEGYWCSYACPAGYSKAQWPESEQPANGESIGGLKCKNGKLWLTRPEKSKKLCAAGSGSTTLINKLNAGVAVCRTDYPGTENMAVPIYVTPGSTQPLTVPYASASYVWKGKQTSAQYYVNDAGVSLEEGCTWGMVNGGKGNWAPMVFGAGVDNNGATYVSLFQNPETTNKLNFNIKIETGNPEGDCKYENQKFYGPGTRDGSQNGCTALVTGTAKYIFY